MKFPGALLVVFGIILTTISVPSVCYPEIETTSWEALSDKDISPYGKAALSFEDASWKHAQTDHFVYHFTNEKEAETIYIHAEIYYKWIKDFFGVSEDKWARKNHIFVFTDKNIWDDFLARINKKSAPGAFTDGWELFVYRQPHWVSARQYLAHEISHIIVFRFMEGPLPLFLNEGFAEFASSRLLAMQLEGSGYAASPLKPLSAEEYTPLKEIAELTSYPADNVNAFYREGEWFVRFLAFSYGKDKLYGFLRAVSDGEDFKKAIERIYAADLETVEDRFKSYAEGKPIQSSVSNIPRPMGEGKIFLKPQWRNFRVCACHVQT